MKVERPKDPALVKLGQNVRTHRKELGLTQEALGFKTGLHPTYIGGIERGERNVSVKNLFQIARALEVPPATLLERIAGDTSSEKA